MAATAGASAAVHPAGPGRSIIGDTGPGVALTAATSPARRTGDVVCLANTGAVCWSARGSGKQVGLSVSGTNFVVVNYSGTTDQGEFQTGTGKCLYISGKALMEGSNGCSANSLTETFTLAVHSTGREFISIQEPNAEILVTGTSASNVWVEPGKSGDWVTWAGP
jgi:hypothetical protein